VEGLRFEPPATASVDAFVKTLGDAGCWVTVRKRKGDDISAACGQLRAQAEEKKR
jgi:23S rRNA (adenine2503-C2)-methyltransferase